jgi:hypothetical protein
LSEKDGFIDMASTVAGTPDTLLEA